MLVYDYPTQMQWLSRIHSPDHPALLDNPEHDLQAAYQAISLLPRFQTHQGHDFAFVFSHPLTYEPVEDEHCGAFSGALKIVIEAAQVS